MEKVNLANACSRFQEQWSPRVAGDTNSFQVKLVKLGGPFHWHYYELEDELFLVVKGRLRMHLKPEPIDLQ